MEVRTIFCPPGPEPLRKDSSISESGGGFGRGGRFLACRAVHVNGRDKPAGDVIECMRCMRRRMFMVDLCASGKLLFVA